MSFTLNNNSLKWKWKGWFNPCFSGLIFIWFGEDLTPFPWEPLGRGKNPSESLGLLCSFLHSFTRWVFTEHSFYSTVMVMSYGLQTHLGNLEMLTSYTVSLDRHLTFNNHCLQLALELLDCTGQYNNLDYIGGTFLVSLYSLCCFHLSCELKLTSYIIWVQTLA